jgi:hypothetical protein
MEEQEKKLLEETHRQVLLIGDQVDEIERKLSRLYRSYKIGRAVKIFYWLIIIGTAFGAYWFIQPYLDELTNVVNSIQQNIKNVRNFTNPLKQVAN